MGNDRGLATQSGFRDVRLKVVDSHGKPLAGRRIELYGLERWCLTTGGEKGTPYWNFVTDRRGRVTVPIGDFAGWANSEVRPGWGVYALVVEPEKQDAGGVSRRFWFDNAPTHHYDPRTEDWAMEWGPIAYLPPEGLDLTVKVEPGYTIEGQIVDSEHPDVPLPGVKVNCHQDLEADTHTGMGGEIFWKDSETDARGHFILKHIYPHRAELGLTAAAWLRTKGDDKWLDEARDVVEAHPSGAVVELEIGASTKPRFRYFGRVTDQAGQPVVNALVSIKATQHSDLKAVTWEEEHSSAEQVHTQVDGTYEAWLMTPWGLGIEVEASGFTEKGQGTERAFLAPGEYDFVLDKAPDPVRR